MRVRINYAIELEEVPTEVKRLYEAILKELQTKFDDLDTVSVENPTDFITRVSEFRTVMGDINAQLAECQGIMQGYLRTLVGPEEQEELQDVSEDG